MSGAGGALAAGALAGYGVAVPLGAIGVLIIHEGVAGGWRRGTAAAAGTALVDLGYAVLALAAGTAVTQRLSEYSRTIQLVGAGVLLAVVARGLIALRRTRLPVSTGSSRAAVAVAGATPPSAGVSPSGVPAPRGGTVTVLRRFVALTAINPLTAVYFVALTAGLGDTVQGTTAAVAFAVGVFASSLSWQLLLALVGALAGARMPSWARTATSLAGYVLVLGYAVKLALG